MDGFQWDSVINCGGNRVNALVVNVVKLLNERFIIHLQKSGHHQALAVLLQRVDRL